MAYLDPSRGGSARAVPPSVYEPPAEGGYWPPSALQAFTLRMASHGLCVSSSMMLGDRCYALEQLNGTRRALDGKPALAPLEQALQGGPMCDEECRLFEDGGTQLIYLRR